MQRGLKSSDICASAQAFSEPLGKVIRLILVLTLVTLSVIILWNVQNAFAEGGGLDPYVPTSNALVAMSNSNHFARQMSESVSLASTFDTPAASVSAPRIFSRGISDGVGVSSEFNSPSNQQSSSSIAPRGNGPSFNSPSQRIEERLGQRIPLGNKSDVRSYNTANSLQAGTPTSIAGRFAAADGGDFNFQELIAPGDGSTSDPDDSIGKLVPSTVLSASESPAAVHGMILYSNLVYGTYSVAIVAAIFSRPSRVRSAKGLGYHYSKPQALFVQAIITHTKTSDRLLIVGVVIIGTAGVLSATAPVMGDAFAVDSMTGVAYKKGTTGGLGYREWDSSSSSWSAEASLTSAGSEIYSVNYLYSPKAGSQLRVIGVLESNGEIDLYYCSASCTTAGSWTGPTLVVDMGTPVAGGKYFGMAFESSSGDLLIVYDKTVTVANDLFYKTFSSTTFTLSSETGYNFLSDSTTDNDIRYFQMASKSGSDEIAMAILDVTNSAITAFIWNGNNFTANPNLAINTAVLVESRSGESFDIAYETSSGAALIVAPNTTTDSALYARYTGGAWSAVSTLTGGINPTSSTSDPTWTTLKSDPSSGSNRIMACATDDDSDFSCVPFNAGTPGTRINLESDTGGSTSRRGDFAWTGMTSNGMAIWYDSVGASYNYRTWDSATDTWNTEVAGATSQPFVWINGIADKEPSAGGVDSFWTFYTDAASTDDIGNGTTDGTSFSLAGINTLNLDAGATLTLDVVSIASSAPKSSSKSISDSITITPSISKNAKKFVSQSISVTDSSSRTILRSKSIADAFSTTDSSSSTVLRSISIADAFSTTDVAWSNVSLVRGTSDTLGMSDMESRIFSANRSAADSIPVTDSLTETMVVLRPMNEIITVTESASRRLLAGRVVTDSVGIAISISKSVNSSVTLTETLAPSDSVTRNSLTNKSQNDAISISENVLAKIATRNVSETLNISPAVSAKISGIGIAQTLTVGDAISSKITGRAISEAVSITDSILRSAQATRMISDSLALTELSTRTVSSTRSSAESLTINAGIVTSYAASRALNESLSVLDALSGKIVTRSISDAVTVVDNLSVKVTGRAIADFFAISDSLVAKITGRKISDGLTISTSISSSLSASRTMSENISLTEISSKNTISYRAAAEIIGIVEVVSDKISLIKPVSDGISLTDTASRTSLFVRTASDSISAIDTVARVYGAQRSISDAALIASSVIGPVSVPRLIQDAIDATDTIYKSFATSRTIGDSLTLNDSIIRQHAASRLLVETIINNDSITARVTLRSLSDALGMGDNLNVKISARAVGDTLDLSDNLLVRIAARGIGTNITINDVISARISSRASSENITVIDNLSAKITGRSISDTFTIGDTISGRVGARAMGEVIALSDQLVMLPTRHIQDTILFTDGVMTSIRRTMSDSVSLADTVAPLIQAKRIASDTIYLEDSLSKTVLHGRSDSVIISDQISVRYNPTLSVSDTIIVDDIISVGTKRIITDSFALQDLTHLSAITLNIVDSIETLDDSRITHELINIGDSLILDENVKPTSFVVNIVDFLDLSAQTRMSSVSLGIVDSIAVSDQSISVLSPAFGDQLKISEAISKDLSYSLDDAISMSDSIDSVKPVRKESSDSIEILESVEITNSKTIHLLDSVTISVTITNISVLWDRSFTESLDLEDCTPFSCNQALNFSEEVTLLDTYVPPPTGNDVLSFNDSITGTVIVNRPINDNMTIRDNTDFSVRLDAPPALPGSPLPPISLLVVPNTQSAGLPPSIPVSVTPLNWIGDMEELKSTLKPTSHLINSTISRNDLARMFITLPTYHVPIASNGEIPGDDLLLSAMAAEIPAGSPVYVPINLAATPETSEHASFMKSMSFEFTPRINSTNFALAVSVVDGPPASYTIPSGSVAPLYLDVRWIGDFGSENPGVTSYYQVPPKFTFSVTEDWAEQEKISRDSNGVPEVTLSLLNKATNIWVPVTTLAAPITASDGVYTYVATLEHFSNYAITANRISASNGGGSSSTSTPEGPQGAVFVTDIADSIAIGDVQKAIPIELIEEFGQKKLTVGIADSIAVLTKPVSYKTFQIGNVNVRMSVLDAGKENIFAPKATATVLVEMANSGTATEKFNLNFWYFDETGKKAYELVQLVELGPSESKQQTIQVPFASAGIFELTVEARSFPDNDLLNSTQLTVTIPWLTVNLYTLIITAVVIMAVSGSVLAILLRRIRVR